MKSIRFLLALSQFFIVCMPCYSYAGDPPVQPNVFRQAVEFSRRVIRFCQNPYVFCSVLCVSSAIIWHVFFQAENLCDETALRVDFYHQMQDKAKQLMQLGETLTCQNYRDSLAFWKEKLFLNTSQLEACLPSIMQNLTMLFVLLFQNSTHIARPVYAFNLSEPVNFLSGEQMVVRRTYDNFVAVMRSIILGSLNERNITGFFPKILGVGAFQESEKLCRDCFVIMPYVERTFNWFIETKMAIPDSVVFEFMLGEFLGHWLHGIVIDDKKPRNYGLKYNQKPRCYQTGETTYCFEFPWEPKRLDYDEYDCLSGQPFSSRSLSGFIMEKSNSRAFIESLKSPVKDFYALLRQFFSAYIMDAPPPHATLYIAPDINR